MIKLMDLLTEGKTEEAAEDFIRKTIKGTEWENKVFAAGGYVRDQLSGKDAKDLDILVNSPDGGIAFSKWITMKIGNYKEGSNPVIFPTFGTAKFNLNGVTHNGVDLTGFDIEAVMPRSEKYTAGSRKPEVQQSTLKGDAERRDLTFNSMFKNLSTGEILDLTGKGKEDLAAGIIRTPLDPDITFREDPLRMLRVVRFYAKYNYEIPLNIIRALKRNASQLENISEERIKDELNKMLVTGAPAKAIKLLRITGLLNFIIPEFKSAYKMTQNVHHSQDVFSHSLTVLSKTQPILIRRLMALFHDIGKTVTRSVTPTGVHFYGHEDAGARMAEEIMKRLKYPNELTSAVVTGIKSHMRLKSGGPDGIKLSDKALRKFKMEVGEVLVDLLDVIHADNISHADASSMPNQIENIKKRLDDLNMTVSKPKLPISGKDLMDMGIKPGPIFAEILAKVTDQWFENPNMSKEEALTIAKSFLSK